MPACLSVHALVVSVFVLCSQKHQTVIHSSTVVLGLYTLGTDMAELLESK